MTDNLAIGVDLAWNAGLAHEAPRPITARKPELLSPAGDRSCLLAAIENGADAVYFGLQRHNARIRATNFEGDDLADVMTLLHGRGVRGYVTLNTLVFSHELADVEASVRELALAGRAAAGRGEAGRARYVLGVVPAAAVFPFGQGLV